MEKTNKKIKKNNDVSKQETNKNNKIEKKVKELEEETEVVIDEDEKDEDVDVEENKENKKEKKKDKKDKKKKKKGERVGLFKSIINFFKGVKTEMSKVVWPDKRSMVKYSIATIVFIIFFALYFFGIELVMAWLKDNIIIIK